jgi:hypothetical protein
LATNQAVDSSAFIPTRQNAADLIDVKEISRLPSEYCVLTHPPSGIAAFENAHILKFVRNEKMVET